MALLRDQVLHNDFIILPLIDMEGKSFLIMLVIDAPIDVHKDENTHIKTKDVIPQECFRLMEARL